MIKKIISCLALCLLPFSGFAASLISNGTFEEGTTGWSAYNGATGCMTQSSALYHSGAYSLQVVADADHVSESSPWKTQIHADFSTNPLPAGDYQISFYICCASGTGTMRCSSVGDEAYQSSVSVSTSWQLVTWTVTSSGALSGFNFDLGYAAQTFFIDDITVVSTSELPLISNGFFGTDISGWSLYNGDDGCYSYDASNGYEGGCLTVVNATADASNQWKTQMHTKYTTSPLVAGDYQLTYYAKCASGTGSVRMSTGALYEADQSVTTSWTPFTWNFTATGEEDGLNIDLAKVANTYSIDNVVLTLLKAAPVDTADSTDNSPYTAVTVTVNPSESYQKVLGIGGGIVYYQNWFEVHANKAAIYDTVFTGLGLSALRVGNWLQNPDSLDAVKYDLSIMKEAKSRLGNTFITEMSSWSAPASLKANASVNGSTGGTKAKASLLQKNGTYVYDEFGQWWRKALDAYHAQSYYPDYISIQNEPDMDATYEATLFNATETDSLASYGKALNAVYTNIHGMENEPKILGAEPLGIGWSDLQNYINSAETDTTQLDGLCFHYYHSGVQTHSETNRYYNPDDFLTAMQGISSAYYGKKPLFMTENCSMNNSVNQDAVSGAWTMANGFNYNRLNAYIFWNLLWGGSKSGCVQVENPWNSSAWTTSQGYIVNPNYHALRHFSKFVRPGMLCIGQSSSSQDVVSAAFVDSAGNNLAIVIINKGTNHKVALSLPTATAAGQAITYTGYAVRSCAADSEWSHNLGAFTGTDSVLCPASSVVTLVLKASSSVTSLPQTAAASSNWIYMENGQLCLNAASSGNAVVSVFDAAGHQVASRRLFVQEGANSVSLGSLPKGVLMVQTSLGNLSRADKVINR